MTKRNKSKIDDIVWDDEQPKQVKLHYVTAYPDMDQYSGLSEEETEALFQKNMRDKDAAESAFFEKQWRELVKSHKLNSFY